MRHLVPALVAAASLSIAPSLRAQGSAADYARADSLIRRFQGLTSNVVERPVWIDANRFWYRKSVRGGNEFVLVDARAKTKSAPFDHARLAEALSSAGAQRYTAVTLPFPEFTYDGASAIAFTAMGTQYRCTVTDYVCTNRGPVASPTPFGGRRPGAFPQVVDRADVHTWFGFQADGDDTFELTPDEGPWIEDDGVEAEIFAQRDRARAAALFANAARQPAMRQPQIDTNTVRSPDGTMEAYINNYNVFVRTVAQTRVRVRPGGGGTTGGPPTPSALASDAPPPGIQLSWDGSEGRAYALGQGQNRALQWSPDSKKIAAYRVTPGYQRMVRFIESSPADQLQPKYREQYYQKPGDEVTLREPMLFDVASRKQTPINNTLFPNPYALTALQWWKDSRGFTFEYNQRGHQVYRIIEVDANTGATRSLVSEEPKTFYSYRNTEDALGSGGGTHLRRDVSDGREIIWMSERDGWKHLYLVDGKLGRVKNPITKGDFAVRNTQGIDTVKRFVWFSAGGKDAGQDPYFTKYYRVNFDGTGLVSYTPENGTHTIVWSPDSAYYVDSWTRVDLPAVTALKRASDQQVVMPIDSGDASALVAAGYQMAEPFTAKGRDGKTDIWGVIVKPSNFDPSKKYPVIEQIYAGPQGSFAPKTFAVGGATRALAEHGFIVVQVDGMGTGNRSKAFHDVAWRNLGDAGFPDRILWHRAIGQKYAWYDTTRVGIYGTSAGGQNALGALLFHGEFYKSAFSAAGCHDNRMDKMWWNEQWMGWPIGPHYAAASNMENAGRLKGELLLVVGELDTNVDPSSTYQVADRLIKANKMFDYLVIPGAGHTNGGAYGVRKMTDFFVRTLWSVAPPARNLSGS